MPQVVRVEGAVEERTINSEQMEHGKVYMIVTPGSMIAWAAGTLVIRGGHDGIAALGKGDRYDVCNTTRVRELRPGETVTITGG